MVSRVVLAGVFAIFAAPATAQVALPYDLGFFRTPGESAPNISAPQDGPQISYRAVEALIYDRVPDYVALGYRLEGLTGVVVPYRNGRDVGPLRYELQGLVFPDFAQAGATSLLGAGAP